jgi:hypothetical protein
MFTVPPTASEICKGLLKCPTECKEYRVWCVPVQRPPNLGLRTTEIPVAHMQRFPILEYLWQGDHWKYRGWHPG